MQRKLYISCFVAFAATFVPVLLNFGLVAFIVPAAYIALFVGGTFLHGEIMQSLWGFGHLVIYLLLFYAGARAAYWLSTRSGSVFRWTVQLIVLVALLSCSFIRSITDASIQGRGGTYTFWGAVSRYLDKHQSR